MDIGKNVKDARKRAQLSQEALARQAGISVSAVAQIEQGERTDPHYSTLSKLAKGLGISVGELLDSPKAEAPTSATSREVEDRRTTETETSLVELARKAGENARRRMEESGSSPSDEDANMAYVVLVKENERLRQENERLRQELEHARAQVRLRT